MVERGGWSGSLAEVRQWLDAVALVGGGHMPTALAEACAEASYLFRCPSALGDPASIQKQCLLLTVSEPHRLMLRWPFASQCSSDKVRPFHDLRPVTPHIVAASGSPAACKVALPLGLLQGAPAAAADRGLQGF